jgi:hypothetical protein
MIAAAEIDLVYVFTDGDMPLTTWKALGNAPGVNSAVIRCGQASRLRGYWRMTDNTEFSWPEAVPPDPRSAKFPYCRPTVRNPRKTGDNISTFSPPKRRKILQTQAFRGERQKIFGRVMHNDELHPSKHAPPSLTAAEALSHRESTA